MIESTFIHSLTLPLNPKHHLGTPSIHSFIHFQVSIGTEKTSGGANTATTSLVGVVAATAMATAAVCLP